MSTIKLPYLYVRGPWPQPAPGFPTGMAPAVMHLPKEERDAWEDHVGDRYKKQVLLETPLALVWSQMHSGVKLTTDARFTEILTDGIFSKFLTADFDEPDYVSFEPRVADVRTGSYVKGDYSVVRAILPTDDVGVAPCVALFRSGPGFQYEPVAVSVGDTVFTPEDGRGWDLAKVFTLQAAGIATTLYQHPMLHFPTDAVNAVIKTLFPKGHVIQQLYLPHFYLALGVDDAVLHDNDTVLNAGRLYAPYPGTLPQHLEIVAALWRGLDRPDGTPNRAYPPYRFRIGPRAVRSRYGEFLQRYYDALYRFGLAVAARVPDDDPLRDEMARHLSFWIPGFPSPEAFRSAEVFAGVFATIVSDVAIGHTADHYLYGQVDIQEVPFRVRAPVPTSTDVAPFDPAELTTSIDALNYRMCMKMFFEPHPVTRLATLDYGFADPSLRDANQRFLSDLVDVERSLERDGIPNYIPLAELTPSVQF